MDHVRTKHPRGAAPTGLSTKVNKDDVSVRPSVCLSRFNFMLHQIADAELHTQDPAFFGTEGVLQIPNGLKKSGPSRCRARFRDKPAGFGDNPEIHFVLIPTLILHFLTGSRQTNAPRMT